MNELGFFNIATFVIVMKIGILK